ncbi:hypothetical protein [Pedobacter zeae]|uniref:Uncharacterized protein n=1 Tax=Pedobacter zeae TaxID=1737356 RepID=A0A7W6P3M8_9SPHI|nr:hypothetical protein [Pedobacter zeae]MBB4106639.1 hypothetical protein [Pedobacter zeae]GGH02882.1 hypothetical protein GCM10007422_17590 [Pedobacter zeae]
MNRSTPQQRMALGIIIKQIGLDKETKELMVSNYSDGRCTSTTELTYQEADHMIRTLNDAIGYKKQKTPSDAMKNKILSFFHFMWYKKPDGKIDMPRVNAWCMQYGYAHKPLDDHTEEELPKLVSEVEQMYKKFLKGI